VEQLADRSGLEGVQSGSGFIKHDQTGVRDQLDTDGCTFTFTTRENLAVDTTDLTVLNVEQSQLGDDSNDIGILLSFGRCQFQTSGESHRLHNSEVGEEHIVLHDISGIASEGVLNNGNVVVKDDVA